MLRRIGPVCRISDARPIEHYRWRSVISKWRGLGRPGQLRFDWISHQQLAILKAKIEVVVVICPLASQALFDRMQQSLMPDLEVPKDVCVIGESSTLHR